MKAAVIHTVSRTEQTILLFEHFFQKSRLCLGLGMCFRRCAEGLRGKGRSKRWGWLGFRISNSVYERLCDSHTAPSRKKNGRYWKKIILIVLKYSTAHPQPAKERARDQANVQVDTAAMGAAGYPAEFSLDFSPSLVIKLTLLEC